MSNGVMEKAHKELLGKTEALMRSHGRTESDVAVSQRQHYNPRIDMTRVEQGLAKSRTNTHNRLKKSYGYPK